MKTISYSLSYDQPLSHWIQIEMLIPAELFKSYKSKLQLPAWRPGRYMLQNYAANVRNFKIESDAKVHSEKVTKDTWKVDFINKVADLRVKYEYYANQLDAGGSMLNDEMLYISPINCLMYIEELMQLPNEISIKVPDDYYISTSLKKEGNVFIASNFYELSDSPFICSKQIKNYDFKVLDYDFTVSVFGKGVEFKQDLIDDFQKFTKYQVEDFWIGFPTSDYIYQVIMLNYLHYHGVEHQNSSMNVFGPYSDLESRNRYIDFIGLCSHELFHTWNVTRLRANEILPYDFSKENYLKSGFVAEGFTTYYGDIMLVRSGVISVEEYLVKFNNVLQRHFQNQGRLHNSIYNSSIELWLDGYEMKAPARKVSIYVKGAMISFAFDLWIRKCTNNKKSLDDVIKSMWNKFYLNNKGYDVEDVKEVINFVCGQDGNELFDDLIYGVVPVEDYINKFIGHIGCQLIIEYPESILQRDFGIQQKGGKVILMDEYSSALNHLGIGDTILQINGEDIKEYDESKEIESDVILKVLRLGEEKEVILNKNEIPCFGYYQIVKNENASPESEEAFKKWLDQ